MARRRKKRRKPFRVPAGFARKDLKSRVLYILHRQKGEPLEVNALEAQAQVKRDQHEDYVQLLSQMEQSGEIWRRRNSVALTDGQKFVKARIVSINEKFGFARPEPKEGEALITGRDQDIYLRRKYMLGCMPGDVVMVRLVPQRTEGEKREGSVAKVLQPNQEPFTGVVVRQPDGYFVRPDRLIHFLMEVEKGCLNGAKEGDKVLVKIASRAQRHSFHKVEIVQTFGDGQSAQVCCQAVLASYNARLTFDEETMAQARKIAEEGVPLSELTDRMDLTGMDIFTIDSADSKDLDDAVSLQRDDEHWYLGVHIADVSHYVRPGTPLDLEAYRRGTSIYYADQVIPMLPKELSNGICSLNPDEVRLTFSALVTLKLSGEIEGFRFVKSYIRSRVKGVYAEINTILDGSASLEILKKYNQLLPQIHLMQQLAQILRKRRFDRGAMNISSNESKFIIEDGKIKDIVPRPTGESERMIEEFMLTANQAAASLAIEQELPFIYRVHDRPQAIKVNLLHELLEHLNIRADRLLENPQPKDFADILESVRGTELEPVINNQLLRTMSKAVYSEKNIGHFGLVLDNYTHFTSPIRRYPDLAIHRILTSYLAGMPKDKLLKRYGSFVPAASKNSSQMEVNAMNIERDCEDCYKAEYMSHHIGEVFTGRITGVTNYGFYVELPNSVEGMVSVRDLPMGDYLLEDNIQLKETRRGTLYRIGQECTVRVASVDVSAGQVNFVLASKA